VLIGNLSHYEIAIMNADGSGLRRYPLPTQMDGWGDPWNLPWSPDGRFLAFRARDRRIVQANDHDSHLALLDVTSGKVRVIANKSPGVLDDFVWRPDGKAIRISTRTDPVNGPSRASIVEVDLNGTERPLRDLTAEFPTVNSVFLSSDREAVVTVAIDKQVGRYVVPLDGGAARRLPDFSLEPGYRLGGTAVDRNRVRIGQIDARGEGRVITILSTVGEPTRTLRLPFAGHHGVDYPDGKQFINVGKATGDSVWKLFLVPLDGSPTRLIGEIPRGAGGRIASSPDGKLLAYTSEGRYTSKIHEIDLSPALKAIMKR
jgi:Tol biopolymer transport system component